MHLITVHVTIITISVATGITGRSCSQFWTSVSKSLRPQPLNPAPVTSLNITIHSSVP